MRKIAIALFAVAAVAFGHTAEPAGAPPAEASAVSSVLQKDGIRIKDGNKTVMELWFRNALPAGGNTEDNATIKRVSHGTLLGVVRFPERGADRRGQTIKPGVYTLRLSFFPQNGDHQGVAPQRDFLLMSPIDADKDPNATMNFDQLVALSQKASGTPHPAVLSVWKAADDAKPGITVEEEHDWVLRHKIGDLLIAVIVAGTFSH
jgi:hypothetical protein